MQKVGHFMTKIKIDENTSIDVDKFVEFYVRIRPGSAAQLRALFFKKDDDKFSKELFGSLAAYHRTLLGDIRLSCDKEKQNLQKISQLLETCLDKSEKNTSKMIVLNAFKNAFKNFFREEAFVLKLAEDFLTRLPNPDLLKQLREALVNNSKEAKNIIADIKQTIEKMLSDERMRLLARQSAKEADGKTLNSKDKLRLDSCDEVEQKGLFDIHSDALSRCIVKKACENIVQRNLFNVLLGSLAITLLAFTSTVLSMSLVSGAVPAFLSALPFLAFAAGPFAPFVIAGLVSLAVVVVLGVGMGVAAAATHLKRPARSMVQNNGVDSSNNDSSQLLSEPRMFGSVLSGRSATSKPLPLRSSHPSHK